MLYEEMSSFKDSLPIILITNTVIVYQDSMVLLVRPKALNADFIVASMEVHV